MPKPGPRPTPTRILSLRGSWRAKRNPKEPQPKVAKPTAPGWLSDDAKKVFEEIAERLHATGVLTVADELALARYADLTAQYQRCAAFIGKHGDIHVTYGRPGPNGEQGRPTGIQVFPQAKLKLALASALLQLEREFGMTPAARAGTRESSSSTSGSPGRRSRLPGSPGFRRWTSGRRAGRARPCSTGGDAPRSAPATTWASCRCPG